MHDYKILIIGNLNDNHIIRFVRNLKMSNPAAHLYLLDEDRGDPSKLVDISSFIEEVFLLKISNRFSSFPILRTFTYILSWRKQFKQIIKERAFDIINIHYPAYQHRFIIDDIKKMSKNIVLTPWGSDVYRIGKIKKILVQKVYDSANIVTGAGDRFTRDFMNTFKIPAKKLRLADMGSETIDYISKHIDCISTDKSKSLLKLEGRYVITCGYNASRAQRHLSIIDSIYSVKDKLPSNLTLLFPVTYPKDEGYINELKERVKSYKLNAVFFETYLDVPTLYLLRQSTDLFIHIQTTDANCATLREYLLCGKKVINGSWLCYDDLETYGLPYYVVDSVENLPKSILCAYNSEPVSIDKKVIDGIKEKGCVHQLSLFNKIFIAISNN